MKKFAFMLIALLLALPLIAQTADSLSVIVDPPDSIIDVISNIEEYMATMLGISVLSVWLTAILNGWFNPPKSWMKLAVSWLVSILLSVLLGAVINIGFLSEETFVIAALYGLGAGLVSNRIFDIGFVNIAVKWIEAKLKGTG